MQDFPKIKRMGERAVLLEFEPEIRPDILQDVISFQRYLKGNLLKHKVEIINTYNSLLVIYHCAIGDVYSDVFKLKEEFSEAKESFQMESKLFHIPVCYDEYFAVDLEEISAAKKLPKSEIEGLHSSTIYTVYFTGFLPGFLYLGGLPDLLHFPRKKHPRSQVQKGAVGIGEKQTGIYPQKSPGGWNIIGNSPVPLFDPELDPPCQIRSGDRMKFYSVNLEEHRQVCEKVERGEYNFEVRSNG